MAEKPRVVLTAGIGRKKGDRLLSVEIKRASNRAEVGADHRRSPFVLPGLSRRLGVRGGKGEHA
jgi:hypothetical protein